MFELYVCKIKLKIGMLLKQTKIKHYESYCNSFEISLHSCRNSIISFFLYTLNVKQNEAEIEQQHFRTSSSTVTHIGTDIFRFPHRSLSNPLMKIPKLPYHGQLYSNKFVVSEEVYCDIGCFKLVTSQMEPSPRQEVA